LIVAETILSPAAVAWIEPVATPAALVVPAGGTTVAPGAVRTTVAPAIGLSNASRAVTMTVLALEPFEAVRVSGAASSVEWLAERAAGVTVTVSVCVMATPFTVVEMIFAPAPVELKVPVATPDALVGPGCTRVFPDPVALSTTVAPEIKFPRASRAVTVIVDDPLPAVSAAGAATSVERLVEGGPAAMSNNALVSGRREGVPACRR